MNYNDAYYLIILEMDSYFRIWRKVILLENLKNKLINLLRIIY